MRWWIIKVQKWRIWILKWSQRRRITVARSESVRKTNSNTDEAHPSGFQPRFGTFWNKFIFKSLAENKDASRGGMSSEAKEFHLGITFKLPAGCWRANHWSDHVHCWEAPVIDKHCQKTNQKKHIFGRCVWTAEKSHHKCLAHRIGLFEWNNAQNSSASGQSQVFSFISWYYQENDLEEVHFQAKSPLKLQALNTDGKMQHRWVLLSFILYVPSDL